MTTSRLTYIFDAYCGWCFGFSPALTQFAADNRNDVEIDVISGGLFRAERVTPIRNYSYIPAANDRISTLTGVTFGPEYRRLLARGDFAMDSTPAAIGLATLRTLAPERSLEAASAMLTAFYRDGLDLADVTTYEKIAADLGLSTDAVATVFADPATAKAAHADFRRAHDLWVDSYPTLMLHTPTGTARLGGAVSTADRLTQALIEHRSTTGTFRSGSTGAFTS